MISDDDLHRLAIFLGSCAMMMIVLYHFLDVNAKDERVSDATEVKSSAAAPQGSVAASPSTVPAAAAGGSSAIRGEKDTRHKPGKELGRWMESPPETSGWQEDAQARVRAAFRAFSSLPSHSSVYLDLLLVQMPEIVVVAVAAILFSPLRVRWPQTNWVVVIAVVLGVALEVVVVSGVDLVSVILALAEQLVTEWLAALPSMELSTAAVLGNMLKEERFADSVRRAVNKMLLVSYIVRPVECPLTIHEDDVTFVRGSNKGREGKVISANARS
ncbi:hypothetical protein BBP40_012050 [Aspergillus hancockii]|nr:hypothetical protein BBP40_012050 [Aspergillus hancockii]